jgi:transketolase
MRNRFIELIHKEMSVNQDIVFLTADMGINLVEKIQQDFPNRYHNVGIAEQNLVGIAAGLAESGFKPFAYTISNFLSIRALEQIRNDIVLHELPVTLVGTSTGFDNGPLGPTHHMLDDWGVLSGMPGLTIHCPASMSSLETMFVESTTSTLPNYIRIPKGPGLSTNLSAIDGKEFIVLTYGSAASYGIQFALESNADYMVIETLKPLDVKGVNFAQYKKITVIEDHFPSIGLYSSVCQFFNENQIPTFIESISPQKFTLLVGNTLHDFLL